MSRIGKIPVDIPDGVKADVEGNVVHINGPLGKLSQAVDPLISVRVDDGKIKLERRDGNTSAAAKSLHGLYRRLIANMVLGVTKGFEKDLEITGVGYKAKIETKTLLLHLGFSHPVRYMPREGIKITVNENTKINIRGIDKELVGQSASEIRAFLPPEPYKGKGIKYKGEYIRRKAGKAVGGKGGAK